MRNLSLSKLLDSKKFPTVKESKKSQDHLQDLQHKMLRIQQGVWHQRSRVIIVFEGFDAAGKGGAIRRLIEPLDPRGIRVVPVGPPDPNDQARHYLYRFWQNLPVPGSITVFDRSWYGRLLVERVEKLIPKERWKDAFTEIVEFEQLLARDGIRILKFFLAIDKEEQLERFESRLKDPYKNWKLTMDDVRARKNWDHYVEATDDIFKKTNLIESKWNLVPANDKDYARQKILEIVTDELSEFGKWMESGGQKQNIKTLQAALERLGLKKGAID